jgi:Ca2+:H+ antiporter
MAPILKPTARKPEKETTTRENGGVLTGSSSDQTVAKGGEVGQLPMHQGQVTDLREGSVKKKKTLSIKPSGESGRSGVHVWHFFRIAFRSSSLVSSTVNFLWPVVPAAIAVRFAMPESHLAIFVLSYIAMVPCANLIGFAGQELARKLPHVFGILAETT